MELLLTESSQGIGAGPGEDGRAEERKDFVAVVKYLLERMPLSYALDALLRRWRGFAVC